MGQAPPQTTTTTMRNASLRDDGNNSQLSAHESRKRSRPPNGADSSTSIPTRYGHKYTESAFIAERPAPTPRNSLPRRPRAAANEPNGSKVSQTPTALRGDGSQRGHRQYAYHESVLTAAPPAVKEAQELAVRLAAMLTLREVLAEMSRSSHSDCPTDQVPNILDFLRNRPVL